MENEIYEKNDWPSNLSLEFYESIKALSRALSEDRPTAELVTLINRTAGAFLNFMRPLGLSMTIGSASGWALITGVYNHDRHHQLGG